MFEKSKWIARTDNIKEVTPAPLLRKEFNVRGRVKNAVLGICGLGHCECTVNGKRVTENVLNTPISKYDTRVYYDTYDVTKLIGEGMNVIGCILGNGWYFVTYHRWDVYVPAWLSHPKLIAELTVEYADGSVQTIASDTSWKTADSAIVYNENKRGEIYDARLEKKGWDTAEYDDCGWDSAFICRSPGGKLIKADFPQIKIIRSLNAKKISADTYDIGENISGWVKIKVEGAAGSEVSIKYAEALHADNTIAPELLNTIEGAKTHEDKYILSGKGIEAYAPRFAYHGFRYVQISGNADIVSVAGEVVHTALESTAAFDCSDDMLNKIHAASLNSTKTNIHGIITDCPQREQNGWTGDALVSCDQTIINFDAAPIYEKWLQDVCDTQRPSGEICCIAPTGGWGYNWGNGPAWDSALILIPLIVYEHTGDLSIMHRYWDNMVLYMEFMESMSDNDTVCFGLGDWCAPEGEKLCPTRITDTAYFYADCCAMARCASLLGYDGKKYTARAAQIKKSFRVNYIEKDFYFGDNAVAIACAIYQGLYNEDEKQRASDRIAKIYKENGYHINCGILGIKYLFNALSKYGNAETAYKLTANPQYPSYAYWILNGMTTLCENWDMSNSLNHHMFSEVDAWLYRHVAGINISDGGKRVVIKPCLMDIIEKVRSHCRGASVSYDKEKITVSCDRDFEVVLGNKHIKLAAGIHTIIK